MFISQRFSERQANILKGGDTIKVHVTNKSPVNGTAIHWHGLRQVGTMDADGVPGVTQCPSKPGSIQTYTFKATQYGTTWYHSHFTLQYADGLLGPIIINGPATEDYTEDLGTATLMVSENLSKDVEGIVLLNAYRIGVTRIAFSCGIRPLIMEVCRRWIPS